MLDDGQIVKLTDLQVIPRPAKKSTHDEPRIEKIERQAKVDKVLKSVGIDQSNVRSGERIRKKKEVFDL